MGTSIKTFLERVGSTQPFLLCIGEKRSSIQKFYFILDRKAIPCMTQTAVAAFDELFKVHFVFAVSYDEALCNFYTFIQTTVYGTDVGTAKECPRVKEIRVRIQNTEVWLPPPPSVLLKCSHASFARCTTEVVQVCFSIWSFKVKTKLKTVLTC